MQYLFYISLPLILSLVLGVRFLKFEGHQRPILNEAPNAPTNPQGHKKRPPQKARCQQYYQRKKLINRTRNRLARKSKQINRRINKP
ncbi:hypothetical protein [Aureispira sp. CCB-QB1]|uniref:hypothetical protein n=1 Tax=Aureispira sp. CCB-QB1 TaxID=1313421 RepID=UPI0006988B4B|nr:hypothetical protein [Aureispira sp. CCB-QB1]